MGVTATQGGGIGNAKAYQIYMPFDTIVVGGTADGTTANQLVDTTKNFVVPTQGIDNGRIRLKSHAKH